MRTVIEGYGKGQWRDTGNGIILSCPSCGAAGYLDDHDIKDTGEVAPSLVCPKDCGYHEFVILKGYSK